MTNRFLAAIRTYDLTYATRGVGDIEPQTIAKPAR